MQNVPKRIRRCCNCNNKTHHKYWEDGVCPVCGLAKGYLESTHDGLSVIKIEIEKQKIQKILLTIQR